MRQHDVRTLVGAACPTALDAQNRPNAHASPPSPFGPARQARRTTIRRAFTLLEVVLALAILTVTLAVALGLLDLGVRNARDARDQTRAQDLAENVMSLITSRVIDPESMAGEQSLAALLSGVGTNFGAASLGLAGDEEEWQCAIDVVNEDDGLNKVTVRVYDTTSSSPVEFTLTRKLMTALYLDELAQLDAAVNDAASSASSSSSSSSSGSTSSGSSTSGAGASTSGGTNMSSGTGGR